MSAGKTLGAGKTLRQAALEHGGDLGEARRAFPNAPEPWIDLSTGINPVAYPLPPIADMLWQRLPAADDLAKLLAAAREAYRVSAQNGIVAAPGTQILIEMLPGLVRAVAEIAVIGPTYGEHARAWRKAGFPVREVCDPGEAAAGGVVVIVNPNNPDGRLVPAKELRALAQSVNGRGGLLVVDEAFADFSAEASIVPDLPPATIVLRSFGKTYGLAGIRLGFAIGPPALAAALADRLGPWAVSGPALAIGSAALGDHAWLAAAAEARRRDAARLDRLLAPHGRVIGGTILFRLLETPDAASLHVRLGRSGIHVRRFSDRPHLLRFGLPADEAAWSRLGAALSGG